MLTVRVALPADAVTAPPASPPGKTTPASAQPKQAAAPAGASTAPKAAPKAAAAAQRTQMPPPVQAARPGTTTGGPPMTGPPTAVLLTGYFVAAGLGLALVGGRKPDGAVASGADEPSRGPSDAALRAGIAAADVWRAASDARYEVLAAAAFKKKAEAEWFAAYTAALRDRVAVRAQLARSAEAQVQRNKAVSARAANEAVEQGVAEPARKKGGILGVLKALLPGRKKS
jgi:hypothetical protein